MDAGELAILVDLGNTRHDDMTAEEDRRDVQLSRQREAHICSAALNFSPRTISRLLPRSINPSACVAHVPLPSRVGRDMLSTLADLGNTRRNDITAKEDRRDVQASRQQKVQTRTAPGGWQPPSECSPRRR